MRCARQLARFKFWVEAIGGVGHEGVQLEFEGNGWVLDYFWFSFCVLWQWTISNSCCSVFLFYSLKIAACYGFLIFNFIHFRFQVCMYASNFCPSSLSDNLRFLDHCSTCRTNVTDRSGFIWQYTVQLLDWIDRSHKLVRRPKDHSDFMEKHHETKQKSKLGRKWCGLWDVAESQGKFGPKPVHMLWKVRFWQFFGRIVLLKVCWSFVITKTVGGCRFSNLGKRLGWGRPGSGILPLRFDISFYKTTRTVVAGC